MKIGRLVFVFILFLFCGCEKGSKKINGAIPVKVEETKNLEFSDLNVVDVIGLETKNENLMGVDLRVRCSDSLIAIMDESMKNGIHLFNNSGEYLNTVGLTGDGPNKLPSLLDFCITDPNEITVLSTMGTLAKLSVFSLENEKKILFEKEFVASSFAEGPNGNFWLYGGYNLPVVKYRLLEVDERGKTIHRYLKNEYENKMLPVTERNFFRTDQGINFIESFNNNVYQIKQDSLVKIYSGDFGKYNIPKAFWKKDIMDAFKMISKKGFANFYGVFSSEKWDVLDVLYQYKNKVFKNILFLDKQKHEVYKLKANRTDKFLFYYPIGFNNEDQLLFITYRSVLLEYSKDNSLPSHLISKLPEEQFDYPVILKVTINE